MARLGTVITVLLVGVAGGVAVAAAGEPRIASQRFDDWFLRCASPGAEKNEAKTQCEVVQIAKVKTTAPLLTTQSECDAPRVIRGLQK